MVVVPGVFALGAKLLLTLVGVVVVVVVVELEVDDVGEGGIEPGFSNIERTEVMAVRGLLDPLLELELRLVSETVVCRKDRGSVEKFFVGDEASADLVSFVSRSNISRRFFVLPLRIPSPSVAILSKQ